MQIALPVLLRVEMVFDEPPRPSGPHDGGDIVRGYLQIRKKDKTVFYFFACFRVNGFLNTFHPYDGMFFIFNIFDPDRVCTLQTSCLYDALLPKGHLLAFRKGCP